MSKRVQYIVSYNQKAIIDAGLLDVMDSKDAQLFSYVYNFIGSCQAVQKDGYHWIAHQKVIDEMPLLKLKNKRSVAARMKHLCDVGILEMHPESQRLSMSMYKVTPLGAKLVYHDPMHENVKGVQSTVGAMNENCTPMHENVKGYASKCEAPMHENVNYSNIINPKSINPNNALYSERAEGENFFDNQGEQSKSSNASSSYPTEQPSPKEKKEKSSAKKERSGMDLVDWDSLPFGDSMEVQYKLGQWFEMMKDQHGVTFKSSAMVQGKIAKLVKESGGNERKALRVLDDTIANGWKSFCLHGGDSHNKGKAVDKRLPHKVNKPGDGSEFEARMKGWLLSIKNGEFSESKTRTALRAIKAYEARTGKTISID